MATATEQGRKVEQSVRWQMSLADLSVLVLAAGLAAGVVRGARDVRVEPGRFAGVGVEVASVFLAVILLRSILGVVRQRPLDAGVTAAGRLASMAWRALAVVLLIHFVMMESGVLRLDLAARRSPSWSGAGLGEWYDVREKLTPLCAILAMFGLAVGMGAGAILARPEPRRPRPYWLFVPLAALAAVLFVAVPGEHAVVPQFILIALEAVNNALHPLEHVRSAGLSARLLRAGIEAIPATLVIVGLALIVARDFQRAGRSVPWATTRAGWFGRVFALTAAGAAGFGMALVAMPTMNPLWINGFRDVIDPDAIVIMLAGFGTFAAGLAARAVVPRPAWEQPRWVRWLSNILALGMMEIVVASALWCLPASHVIDPELPPILGRLLVGVESAHEWFWGLFSIPLGDADHTWLDPRRLVWMLPMVGLAVSLGELALRSPSLSVPAFDRVAGSPGRLARFAWLTLGLTVICLAALPTLIVAGQVILHIRNSASTWTRLGWPSPF